MASTGGGEKGTHSASDGGDGVAKENVTDLLLRLNLTEVEEAILDFSDDEGEDKLPPVEWAVVGKILSPSVVHVNIVRSAMKPAWGNPCGLKIRRLQEDSSSPGRCAAADGTPRRGRIGRQGQHPAAGES
jgi:hypothetical protein